MPGQYMQYGYERHINSAEMTQFKLKGGAAVRRVTESPIGQWFMTHLYVVNLWSYSRTTQYLSTSRPTVIFILFC